MSLSFSSKELQLFSMIHDSFSHAELGNLELYRSTFKKYLEEIQNHCREMEPKVRKSQMRNLYNQFFLSSIFVSLPPNLSSLSAETKGETENLAEIEDVAIIEKIIGWTALQIASNKGKFQIVDFILNAQQERENWIQYHTSEDDDESSVSRDPLGNEVENPFLSQLLSFQGSSGHSAFQMAVLNGCQDVVLRLLGKREIESELETIKSPYLFPPNIPVKSILRLADQCVLQVQEKIGRGRNGIYLMSRSGMLQGIRLANRLMSLTETNKNLFLNLAREKDQSGYDSLMAAAFLHQAEVCSFLIDEGLKASEIARDGANALNLACRHSLVTHASSSSCNLFNEKKKINIDLELNIQNEQNIELYSFELQRKFNSISRTIQFLTFLDQRNLNPNDPEVGEVVKFKHIESFVHSLLSPDCFGSSLLHTAAMSGNWIAIRSFFYSLQSIQQSSPSSSLGWKIPEEIDPILFQFKPSWIPLVVCQDDDGHHPTHSACSALGRATEKLMRLNIPSTSSSLNTSSDDSEKRIIEFEIHELLLTIKELLSWGYPLDAIDYSDSTMLHNLCYLPTRYQYDMIQWIVVHSNRLLCTAPLPHIVEHKTEDRRTCLEIASRFPVPATCCLADQSQAIIELLSPLISQDPFRKSQNTFPDPVCNTASIKATTQDDNPTIPSPSPPQLRPSRYLLRRGPHNRISESLRWGILRGKHSLGGVGDYLQRILSSSVSSSSLSPLTSISSFTPRSPEMENSNRNNRIPRVVVLVGAGISTSAGIPDFRGRNGLYSKNENTAVQSTSADGAGENNNIFSLEVLVEEPDRFYGLIRDQFMPIVDGLIKPTPCHLLLRILKEMGWLTRCYTQNIDMLEKFPLSPTPEPSNNTSQVSIQPTPLLDPTDLVECHGTFSKAFCTQIHPKTSAPPPETRTQDTDLGIRNGNGKITIGSRNCSYSISMDSPEGKEEMEKVYWSKIRIGQIPLCPRCQCLLRPDVVFFGEPLSDRFSQMSNTDFPSCDMLLVMGTTLLVYPVAGLTKFVPSESPRVLINNEPSGCFQFVAPSNLQVERSSKELDKNLEIGLINPPTTTFTLNPLELIDGEGPHVGFVENSLQFKPNSTISTIIPLSNTDPWNQVTYRDIFFKGSCDEGAWELAKSLGLENRLRELIQITTRI